MRNLRTNYNPLIHGLDLHSPAAILEEGERTETFRLGGEQLLMNGNVPAKISVEDFAVAVLDEEINRQFIRQQFTAAY